MADLVELAHPDFGADAEGRAPRSRLGLLLAGVLALAASGGLAWWAVSPERRAPPPAIAAPAAPPAPLRYAAAEPDPAAVKRAHAQAQRTFIDGGPQALVRASTACAKAVPVEPQRLDGCLAFDTYAAEMVSAGEDAAAADWFADSGRDLALARTALPTGSDAANRIAQIRALAQAVLPKPAPPRPHVRARPARPKPSALKAKRPKLRMAKTKAKRSHVRPWSARPHSARRLEGLHSGLGHPALAALPPPDPALPFAPGEPFEDPPH